MTITPGNLRDLGGLRLGGGRMTRAGVVYRSGAPCTWASDVQRATPLSSFAAAIDLRSEAERRSYPSQWPAPGPLVIESAVNVDIRVLDQSARHGLVRNPTVAEAVALMRSLYAAMPQACAGALTRLFSLLCEDHAHPVLIHCTAGKDRTGFVSAILLMALGLSKQAVYQDYLVSEGVGAALLADGRMALLVQELFGVELPFDAMEALAGVRAEYLDTALDAITREYGSFDGYVEKACDQAPT